MNNSLKSNLNTKQLDNAVVDLAAHGLEKQIEDFINNCASINSTISAAAYRKTALDKFKQTGIPNTRLEDWRYTDLQGLVRSKFQLKPINVNFNYSDKLINAVKQYIAAMVVNNSTLNCAVLLDGVYQSDLSVLKDEFNQANQVNQPNQSNKNSNYLGSINQYQYDLPCLRAERTLQKSNVSNLENPMMHFIDATWYDGIVIDYQQNNKRDKTNIIVLNILTQYSHTYFINTRNICLVGNNQDLELIEEHLCFDMDDNLINNPLLVQQETPNLSNNLTFDVCLSENARCTHYMLQNYSQNIYHIGLYNVTQNKSSEYNNYNVNFGAKLARQDIIINQQEEHACCNLYGLFLPKAKQHMDSHLKVMHNSSYGKSTQNYLGVLSERGHGVFNGMVYVEQDTISNNATQSNKNILLSSHAQIDTKPELQIYTDDVICSHGATIGRIDENALFYLQSRGIDEIQARHLLITAFINNILSLIKNELVLGWLDKGFKSELAYITNVAEKL
jgi:Fe-S cluster assembly protein SufD